MHKVLAALAVIGVSAVTITYVYAAKNENNGFDEFGNNRRARIFNGTGMSWCLGKIQNEQWCIDNYGTWANDKLIMKWNEEWDRGNSEGWNNPPYEAWENNEWNGKVPGGSGEVWHYKIKWVGPELQNSPYWSEGGYPVWEQFEIVMDQGSADGEHFWGSHGLPTGYGVYKGE